MENYFSTTMPQEFFLGMILGQFTVAGVWAIVDTITGSVGNSIFWI